MATEGPLTHDGSQTVAAANYGSSQYLAVALSTSADRTVVLASTQGQQVYGILQNKPATGQAADVGLQGISKAVAGGTITRGNPVMTNTSGQLVAWTSGSLYAQIGWAIESAVSGQIFTVYLPGTSLKGLT